MVFNQFVVGAQQDQSDFVQLTIMSLFEDNDPSASVASEEIVTLSEEKISNVAEEGSEEFKMDHTVPPGWSYIPGWRINNQKFKCPKGYIYQSRATAFEKMISRKDYSIQDTMAMKQLLKYEGWEESKHIPVGWKIKTYKNNSVKLFMEQGGRRFNSASKALKFVKMYRKYYSVDDLRKLEALATGNQNRRDSKIKTEKQKPVHISDSTELMSYSSWDTLAESKVSYEDSLAEIEILKTPACAGLMSPSSVSSAQDKEAGSGDNGWEEDETKYPKGWKYLRYSKKTPQGKIFYQQKFMAPNKQKFRGLRAALAHMIKTNFPEDDIRMLRKAMIESGWKQSENLPKLWFYKRDNKSVDYVDASGNNFATKNRAIAYAAKENMHAEDLEKLKNFQPSKEDNIKQEVTSPEEIEEVSSDQDNSMEISVVGEQNTLNESVINDQLFGDDFQDDEFMQIKKDEEVRPLEDIQHSEETSVADQEDYVDLIKYLPQGWKYTKSKSNEGKRDKKKTWILSTEEGNCVGGIRSAYE